MRTESGQLSRRWLLQVGVWSFGAAVFATLLSFQAAIASGGEHASNGPITIGRLLSALGFYWVNFLIFTGGIVYLTKDSFLSSWIVRRASIEKSIYDGKISLDKAVEKLKNARLKIEAVGADVANLKQSLQDQTLAETTRILTDARKKADSIIAQAGMTIIAEQNIARQQMHDELANRALEVARQKLVAAMTPETDRQIRGSALSLVSELVRD